MGASYYLHEQICLQISDHGHSFDTQQSVSFGLLLMQECANTIGAELKVTSQIGEGTTIQVLLNCRMNENVET